jgi:hypothetical protein
MRLKTKQLTMQIREALLELPDRVLMKLLMDWILLAEEHLQYPDWSDEYRYALGFRVQSEATQTIYATFEAMHENEPDAHSARWLEPGMSTLRILVRDFTLEQFYQTIIPLVSSALFERAMQERWGPPPSTLHNGYEFLQNLHRHLEAMIYRRPDRPSPPSETIASPPQAYGRSELSDPKDIPLVNEEYPTS